MAAEEQVLQLCGTPLVLRRAGTGPTLVVLHDAISAGEWSAAMDRLAERFTVLLPRHPGWGGSELPAWLDRVPDLANFHLDLLDALDLRDVHLVGLSLGGWVAAEMAIRNTGRLASLTLVDATGIQVPGAGGIDDFLTGDEQTIRDLFHDPALAAAAAARLLAPEGEEVWLRNRIAAAQLTWQPRHHDPHLAKWLHRIGIPTLIVWGDDDRLLPRPYAAAWQQAVPGSRLTILPDCGHLPHLERPDGLAEAIAGFVAERREAA